MAALMHACELASYMVINFSCGVARPLLNIGQYISSYYFSTSAYYYRGVCNNLVRVACNPSVIFKPSEAIRMTVCALLSRQNIFFVI